MEKSKYNKVNWLDILFSLGGAFLMGFSTGLIEFLQLGRIPSTKGEWAPIIIAGLVGLLGTLRGMSKFNSKGEWNKPEQTPPKK